MAKQNKKLTAEFLKKREKQLSQREKHTIEIDGEAYDVEVDKFFVKSKIAELSSDIGLFATLITQDEKYKDLDDAKVSALAQRYIYGMLIKYFTNIEVSNEVVDVLIMVKTIEDLGILGELLQIMNQDELANVLEEVNTRLEFAIETFRAKLEELNIDIEKTKEEAEAETENAE